MKRIAFFFISLALMLSCTISQISALDIVEPQADSTIGIVEPKASSTINSTLVKMKAGSQPGELRITYEVTAVKSMTKIGVSYIAIYKADGTYVATIIGSKENGLISTGSAHSGTYSYSAAPGGSYYAVVTLCANTTTDSDSRIIETPVVKAP